MDRNGNLVWWLVCIGLVIILLINHRAAINSSSDQMVALDTENQSEEMIESDPQLAKGDTSENELMTASPQVQTADEILLRMNKARSEVVGIEPLSSLDDEPEMLDDDNRDLPFIDLSPEADATSNAVLVDQTEGPLTSHPTEFDSNVGQASSPFKAPAQKNNWDAQRIRNPYFDRQPEGARAVIDPVLTHTEASESTSQTTGANVKANSFAVSDHPQKRVTDFGKFETLEKQQSDWGEPVMIQVAQPSTIDSQGEITPFFPAEQKLSIDSATIQQCVNHIEYGKSLARRGAAFAAREEFFSALRLVAQSYDVQARTNAYTSALTEAITALNEADDFYRELGHEGIDVNVSQVIDAHESKIISEARAHGMSSVAAIQAYFEYSRRRFADAFGKDVVASEALFSLGKLFTVAATHDLTGNPLDYSKAMVMHYAAIDSDPNNFKSANELGALMARNGRLEKARDLFQQSLQVQKMPQTWRNLAVVHQRLSRSSTDPRTVKMNQELAQMADYESQLAARGENRPAPRVQWVSPQQFEETAPNEFNEYRTARAQPFPASPQPVQEKSKPNMLERLRNMF